MYPTAKDLLSISGGLWAFFGLSLFTVFKEVVLREQAKPIPERVADWLSGAVIGLFVVNFTALLVVQTYGVSQAAVTLQAPWWYVAWAAHDILLAGYLFIAACTFMALRAALEVKTSPNPPLLSEVAGGLASVILGRLLSRSAKS